MEATITKTTKVGTVITAVHSTEMVKTYFEGVESGEELISSLDSLTLTKDGEVIIKARTDGDVITTKKEMPEGGYGVILTHGGGVAIPEAAYKLVEEAIKEAKEKAENGSNVVVEKASSQLIVNPKYADLTKNELTELEKNHDDINNEGEEGFNPYRDNLISDCDCRFESEKSNAVLLCDECSKLPCHTGT